MKRVVALIAMMMFVCSLTTVAWAENATQNEVITKCVAAAQLIKDKGVNAAIQAIGSKTGPFVWKDSYVFLMDMDGNMLAHPLAPELSQRKDLLTVKNSDGKYLFKEFLKVANEKNVGWVDYMFPKPGQETPVAKSTYVLRVYGTHYIVGAGIYK